MPNLSESVLVAASAQDRPTIERLIQLYLYDMAADHSFPIGDNGEYEYGLLDQFWEHAYLFRTSNELSGFALVISRCPITGKLPCWFMAEFFVLRNYRRQSVGRAMLQAILARHKGPWHIASQIQNEGAGDFWSRSIPTEERSDFNTRFDDADWIVRSFVAN